MKQDDKRTAVILSLIGIIPVVWLALKIAPSVGGGLAAILPELMSVFENPFHIELCEDSVKAVLVLLLLRNGYRHLFLYTQKLQTTGGTRLG